MTKINEFKKEYPTKSGWIHFSFFNTSRKLTWDKIKTQIEEANEGFDIKIEVIKHYQTWSHVVYKRTKIEKEYFYE